MPIDRQRVRSAFQQHAAEYDVYANVQKRVVRRLTELLSESMLTPCSVLDIGAGTGMLLGEAALLYPDAGLVGIDLAFDMAAAARSRLSQASLVTADAEKLPFSDATFDLVVSTSTFQWLDDLDAAFAEAYRVLKPGSSFVFALFGEHTLHELRDSYRLACRRAGKGGEERPQHFFTMKQVKEALRRAGFCPGSVFSEVETDLHEDVPALLRSIRRIGAGNPASVLSKGLSERRVMLEMMDIYRRQYAQDGVIPATYDVIYAAGTTKS
ncbi:malonyl-ACP O-methyltransferase BioC [Geobacter sp. DSM 9736]|uniref:malonyl-ACP O-methyltransferase BioC n=1 Tax=Geobacter sp. DSM 9736 TaxID=1277350 RepID=UPI000B5F19AA|nr:malonyl-ACP O-methyltransferase BioC [Geobacter sp. DSM 9736]SNB46430.1 malonyl-CoA O-methyltransferase [Geobacter sp. DSM 9736]